MALMLAMSRSSGRQIAEVGFLLLVIAGIWLVASRISRLRWRAPRTVVAGVALAVGGALLVVAVHWGHFG